MAKSDFKLTYSTMFDPPEEVHVRFEDAVARVRASFGATYSLFVDGADRASPRTFEKRSPIDASVQVGRFASASREDVDDAMRAATRAFPAWRKRPTAERLSLVRKVGDLIEERVYEIAAAMTIEVGKNRMESLGEVQETAEFFRIYPALFEQADGYDTALPDDPLTGWTSHNRSVMKPYGVWGVISPFNFPFALSGGPVAAALVTGNTAVLKVASDTPLSGRLLADCIRDAGIPAGVFNLLTGTGREVGEAMVSHPELAGITFTGSYDVGMGIYRGIAAGRYPKPAILEMGGKNAAVVTRSADLERAAIGIVRSAYGLQGQKCSALSRIYVDRVVADELIDRVRALTDAIRVGDPTMRENWMGPVIHSRAADAYAEYVAALCDRARLITGGRRMSENGLGAGFYCAPTLVEAALEDPFWKRELFLPIAMIARVDSTEQAIGLANDSDLGLTAGIFGDEEEVDNFLEHIEAGVTYANRPQGATTGAWPGYQAFGGWKGSGSTGKAIGSRHYLPLYLREQSQTVVE